MKKLIALGLVAINVSLMGCAATMLIGEAVRSGQEDINVVIPPSSTVTSLDKTTTVGVSLAGIDESGKYFYAFGSGSSNAKVYSDMVQIALLEDGYSARVLTQMVTENSPKAKLDALNKKGIELVLSGNVSFGSSRSFGSAITGGNYLQKGISSYTIKGISTQNGEILFIASTEYGVTKEPSEVAADISKIYDAILSGNTEKFEY